MNPQRVNVVMARALGSVGPLGVCVCVCVKGGGRVFAWRGARRAGATDLGILDYSQHLDRPKLLELSPQLVLGRKPEPMPSHELRKGKI